MQAKIQKPEEIIDVASYLVDEARVYPEGARTKAVFYWPSGTDYSFCIPSRLYMFKLSRPVYPEQFWIEIFAYHLGCLMDISVPPAFAAYNSEDPQQCSGVLIEWFYDQDRDSYERGSDIMQRLIVDYEIDVGVKHNFQTIVRYLESLNWGNEGYLKPWVKTLTFDAIMGNGDRHQGNWGIITLNKDNPSAKIIKISPAFDNGSSMGIEILNKNFAKFDDRNYMEQYVSRGKPHLSWEITQNQTERKRRDNHEEFLRKIVQSYPGMQETMVECIRFPMDKVKEILESLCSFNMTCSLTEERAEFMLKLLKFRQERLLVSLGVS